MEQDKNISCGDSFIEIQGSEKGFEQFEYDILNLKSNFCIIHKTITQNSCEINEKDSEKVFNINLFFFKYKHILLFVYGQV